MPRRHRRLRVQLRTRLPGRPVPGLRVRGVAQGPLQGRAVRRQRRLPRGQRSAGAVLLPTQLPVRRPTQRMYGKCQNEEALLTVVVSIIPASFSPRRYFSRNLT